MPCPAIGPVTIEINRARHHAEPPRRFGAEGRRGAFVFRPHHQFRLVLANQDVFFDRERVINRIIDQLPDVARRGIGCASCDRPSGSTIATTLPKAP